MKVFIPVMLAMLFAVAVTAIVLGSRTSNGAHIRAEIEKRIARARIEKGILPFDAEEVAA